jgi:hypothetical protein
MRTVILGNVLLFAYCEAKRCVCFGKSPIWRLSDLEATTKVSIEISLTGAR